MKNKRIKKMMESAITSRLKYWEEYCGNNGLMFVVGNCGQAGFISHNYAFNVYQRAFNPYAGKCVISIKGKV